MRLTLDTNVIVSALLSPTSVPAKVLSLVLNNEATLVFDSVLLAEYSEALQREKFAFDGELIAAITDFIKTEGEFALSSPQGKQLVDKGDEPFYDLHKTAQTDYLVTGNTRHFPHEADIVTPKELLDIFARKSKAHETHPQ